MGDAEERSPGSVAEPSVKPNSTLQFDSVKGHTKGSDVYILYKDYTAYPTYLVSFVGNWKENLFQPLLDLGDFVRDVTEALAVDVGYSEVRSDGSQSWGHGERRIGLVE